MVKQAKLDQVEEIKKNISNSEVVLFVDYRGLDVASVTDLRGQLRSENVSYKVFKNTLAKIAFGDDIAPEVKAVLEGPTAFAFSNDPVSVSKVLSKFAKENEDLELKGGVYQGNFLSLDEIKSLSTMASRDELVAKVVYMLKSPLTGLANVLGGPTRGLVYALNAIKDTKEN